MSSNVIVKGLSIKNSPQVHLKLDGCHVVHINSLRIISPPASPNTDGIHIENSNSVEIYNSVISNGIHSTYTSNNCLYTLHNKWKLNCNGKKGTTSNMHRTCMFINKTWILLTYSNILMM